jgi:alpha-tubulin suppressor-like RCC1 family protein
MKKTIALSGLVLAASFCLQFGAEGSTVAAWGTSAVVPCPEDLTNAIAISAGLNHALALRADGTVRAWGENGDHQTDVPAGLTDVVGIAGGFQHSVAVRRDGTVVGWGRNNYGQRNAPAGLTNAIAVAAGLYRSLALTADGRVWNWGQYFDPSQGIFLPLPVPQSLTNAMAIAAGDDHDVFLLRDGTVVCWGVDDWGQIDVPAGLTNVVAVAAGGNGSMALKSDGKIVRWGYQQGDPPTSATNGMAIAIGQGHNLILTANRKVVAWGRESEGQTTVPPGLTNVTAISAGRFYSLALVGDPVVDSPPPRPVPTGSQWSNGVFRVTVTTVQGKSYRLECRTGLGDTGWTALSAMTGNGSDVELRDEGATDGQRFYRVRAE